ncbi:hypothetical protein IFM89_018930, partial [Coptis chinensis]
MSIFVRVSGQWLASVGEVVHYVAWNPVPELRILATSMGHDVLLMNSGLGNEEEQEKIKNFYILRLLNHLMNPVGHVTSAVNWLQDDKYDGIRLKHLKEGAITPFSAFGLVSPETVRSTTLQ